MTSCRRELMFSWDFFCSAGEAIGEREEARNVQDVRISSSRVDQRARRRRQQRGSGASEHTHTHSQRARVLRCSRHGLSLSVHIAIQQNGRERLARMHRAIHCTWRCCCSLPEQTSKRARRAQRTRRPFSTRNLVHRMERRRARARVLRSVACMQTSSSSRSLPYRLLRGNHFA